MIQIHGTCIALGGAGVLLRGASGSGKSDLALRLIDRGAHLVADDQTALELMDGRLVASCPAPISGLLEIRGIGVVPVACIETVRLDLAVDLVSSEAVDRAPAPQSCTYLGVPLRLLRLAGFDASTPAKLRLAVAAMRQNALPTP